jgi:hypothetical protein
MINPEVGDYVISTTKIYEIVSIDKLGLQVFYSIRLVDNPADILNFHSVLDNTKFAFINLARLRHMGEIVKKEDASKAIEVLFKNS